MRTSSPELRPLNVARQWMNVHETSASALLTGEPEEHGNQQEGTGPEKQTAAHQWGSSKAMATTLTRMGPIS